MSQWDGGNYEGQTPFAMPQNQERRAVANQMNQLSPEAQRRMRQADRTAPRQIYPPQTQNERYPAQPMLESDAMRQELLDLRRQVEGLGYFDPVTGSNPENFGTIGLPYVYCLDQATAGFIELASGATGTFTVAVSADADFIMMALTARATREFTYVMSDSGADRRLSSQPVSAIASLGGVGRVFSPTVPQLMKAATTILVQITDGGNQSPNIYDGTRVSDANLEPSVADPQVLVNKIGMFFIGVKRVRQG